MARMTGDDIGGEGGADHIHMTAPTTHVRKTTEWWPRRRGAASLTRTAEDPRWWWTGTPPPFPPAVGGGPAVVANGVWGRTTDDGVGARGRIWEGERRQIFSFGYLLKALCFSVKHSKAFLKLCNKLT
jgi:hypothetical protein